MISLTPSFALENGPLRATMPIVSARFEPSVNTRGGLAPWQEKRVLRFIVENAIDHFEVSRLAAITRLSPGHFSRAFRASFGISPYAMVCRCRIEEAKRLLASSNSPLVEIAYACGFSDQSHFARQFRRYMQASPGRWRRNPEALPFGSNIGDGTAIALPQL